MDLFDDTDYPEDLAEIDRITGLFFDLFTNTDGKIPKVRSIRDFFLESGIIINNTGEAPVVYDLEGFIQPREEMLTNGTLTNFSEWEVANTTEVFRNIAQRYSYYEKSGERNGEYFEGRGVKTMQFIKVTGKWMLFSVAWCDV